MLITFPVNPIIVLILTHDYVYVLLIDYGYIFLTVLLQ